MLNIVEDSDIPALKGWAEGPIPDGLPDLQLQLARRIKEGKNFLPAPNQDIELREVVPLNPKAYRRLQWIRRTHVPIAEINDGDLLLIALCQPVGAVVAYFHDGDEFEVLYSSGPEMAGALSVS